MGSFNLLRTRGAVFIRHTLLLMVFLLAVSFDRAAGADAPPPEIPASYALAAENGTFQLYLDSATLAFKLLDKRSNYLWHSGIDEPLEDDRLNRSWRAFAQSGLSIEYLDEKAVNKRISIANTEHMLEITPVEQGVSAQVTFQEYGITVVIVVQLEAEGVRVEVPFDSIREENAAFRLGLVYVYPFLGATRGGSVPGYMFMPDGIGSLIRFAETTKAQNMFYGRYYGDDLGILAVMPYSARVKTPYPISFPVFGMVHGEGENAFLSVVEKGAAYGEVQVHPAGVLTNFNFLYNAFLYNESYFQATNRSGAGVTTMLRQPNRFDAVVHFRFLSGSEASYVGMARSYQQYLLDRGLLRQSESNNPNMGVRLEFLGGDKEKILFWHRFIAMTTIRQMSDILDALQLPNPEVIYYGWQPFGASTMAPTTLALDSGLGGIDELRGLVERISTGGGNFSLYLDPQSAYWGESGYSLRSDVAMAVTNRSIEGFNRLYSFYFSIDPLRRRFAEQTSTIAAQLPVGLALDTIGSMLYSDFRSSDRLNREETVAAYQNLLAEAPQRLGFYRPNDYLFGTASAYYDMPLSDNGYIYTSESVPFLPIVLSGYMPYYGPALNFSSNQNEDRLRLVEYGIYPSYFLTHEPTANMLNTASAWIYTSSYAQWGQEVRETFTWMNALLAPVRGQQIVGHERLAEGVYATTYSSGRQIIVNYTDQPFVRGGVTVEAKNALLVENGL